MEQASSSSEIGIRGSLLRKAAIFSASKRLAVTSANPPVATTGWAAVGMLVFDGAFSIAWMLVFDGAFSIARIFV